MAGQDDACPGFAPEVELYTFRVFTNDQARAACLLQGSQVCIQHHGHVRLACLLQGSLRRRVLVPCEGFQAKAAQRVQLYCLHGLTCG